MAGTTTLAVDGAVIAAGTPLPPKEVVLDRVAVVMGAATTNTFFEGHLDPEYARRQGRPDVYLATGAIAGLVDRYVLAWLGPEAFLRSRSVRMRSSLCAGELATFAGAVSAVQPGDDPGRGRRVPGEVLVVTIDVSIANPATTCVTARVRCEVPVSSGAGS